MRALWRFLALARPCARKFHHPRGVPNRCVNPGAGRVVTSGKRSQDRRDLVALIVLDRAAGLVRVVVADDGEGMSPETLAEIFNLFVSTKGARGTGLGLTVSRKILREHGGDIHATSREGAGSTFVLEFPLRPPHAEASS